MIHGIAYGEKAGVESTPARALQVAGIDIIARRRRDEKYDTAVSCGNIVTAAHQLTSQQQNEQVGMWLTHK